MQLPVAQTDRKAKTIVPPPVAQIQSPDSQALTLCSSMLHNLKDLYN